VMLTEAQRVISEDELREIDAIIKRHQKEVYRNSQDDDDWKFDVFNGD
jgi:hypothetical protein